MLNANGPGFAGLYAGDTVHFIDPRPRPAFTGVGYISARVLPLLVFADHVLVKYGRTTSVVSADNFIRLARRGKLHMAVDCTIAALERGKAKGQNIYD